MEGVWGRLNVERSLAMKKHSKKLTLHRETVRQLSQKETALAAAGGITNATACVQSCLCTQLHCPGTNGCT